jgi:hypothetical protein
LQVCPPLSIEVSHRGISLPTAYLLLLPLLHLAIPELFGIGIIYRVHRHFCKACQSRNTTRWSLCVFGSSLWDAYYSPHSVSDEGGGSTIDAESLSMSDPASGWGLASNSARTLLLHSVSSVTLSLSKLSRYRKLNAGATLLHILVVKIVWLCLIVSLLNLFSHFADIFIDAIIFR